MCVSYMRNVCCKHEIIVIIFVWLMDFEAFRTQLISVNPAKHFCYRSSTASVGRHFQRWSFLMIEIVDHVLYLGRRNGYDIEIDSHTFVPSGRKREQ